MAMTSRERVEACLTFSTPDRVPRDLWTLPWAEMTYPDEVAAIRRDFPDDFTGSPNVYNPSPREKGSATAVGTYVDAWGCVFENVHEGIIGEVKDPILDSVAAIEAYELPYEILPEDLDGKQDGEESPV